MKFSSILKKINFKSRKSMLKTGAILFWTDMKRLFNWNIDNFKSNSLARGQLGSKSNDKFFLSVIKMWQWCKYVFGNLIFALTARTLSGNHLKHLALCLRLFRISFIIASILKILLNGRFPILPLWNIKTIHQIKRSKTGQKYWIKTVTHSLPVGQYKNQEAI